MSADPLAILWQCADRTDPVLVSEDFENDAQIARLEESGIIRPGAPATHVACYDCSENHDAEVIPIPCTDGSARFFIVCPENGRVEIPKDRLRQWRLNWRVVADGVALALDARGPVQEIVPDRVWSLGPTSLAGRSRPVWAVRGLAWADARSVVGAQIAGLSPVVFFVGRPPETGVLDIPPDSLFDLRLLLRFGNGFEIARDAVDCQLGVAAEGIAPKKVTRRNARLLAVAGAIKRELESRILTMKDSIYKADERGQPFKLPRTTQKELAAAIREKPYVVTRAIQHSRDPWLVILLDTVKDKEKIRLFKRKK